jgi:multiple sugar transport system permease protein
MRRSLASRLIAYATLVGLAFVFVAPVLFMLVGSLKPDDRVLVEAATLRSILPADVQFDNYADVFARVAFGRYMFNSLLITASIVAAGLVVNSLAGYAFARFVFPGRDILFSFVLAIMIVPIESIAVPLFYEVSLFGWRDTYLVQIVPFIANAFSIYLFYTFFIGLPRELEEAARLDGAGGLRTFVTIIVPNSKPVFASVAILTFLTQWSSFLWPLMVTSSEEVRPLPLAIATFYTLPPLKWGDIFAFGVMMVVPVLIVFLIFQRYFVRGVAASGIKG